MREAINDKPFHHVSAHGCVFEAERSDFVGGVTVIVPLSLSPAEIIADAVEMGALHRATIVPQLKNFTGPGEYTIQNRAEEERERLLETPLLKFFSLETLREFQEKSFVAARTHNCLLNERQFRSESSHRHLPVEYSPIETVGAFLEQFTRAELLRVPNMGWKSLHLIERVLHASGLSLKS